MIPHRLIGLCVLACATGASAKPDLSTPQAATQTFYDAVYAGDLETAKAASLSSGADGELVETYTLQWSAFMQYEGAMHAQFGRRWSDMQLKELQQSLKLLTEGEVKLTGDTAEFASKALPEPLRLKKVDGQWKVDPNTLSGATVLKRDMVNIRAQARAKKEIVSELPSGKYKTVAAALKATNEKQQAAAPTTSTTGPTSRPAEEERLTDAERELARKTALAFVTAFESGDAAGARKIAINENAELQGIFDALCAYHGTNKELYEAAKAAYPNEQPVGITDDYTPAMRTYGNARIVPRSKTRAVFRGDSVDSFALMKIDGEWKVDLSTFGILKLNEVGEPMLKKTNVARLTTIDEIKSKRYATWREALAVHRPRLQAAMGSPASQPN